MTETRRRRRTKVEVKERRARGIEMKARGETWQKIADELGYASRGAALKDIQKALDARLDSSVEELRAVELARLDELQRAAWAVLRKPHLLVQGGNVVTVEVEAPDGTTSTIRLQDDGPVLAAIATLLRVSERRARLTGMDAPTQVELPGTVRVELVGVDVADALS